MVIFSEKIGWRIKRLRKINSKNLVRGGGGVTQLVDEKGAKTDFERKYLRMSNSAGKSIKYFEHKLFFYLKHTWLMHLLSFTSLFFFVT